MWKFKTILREHLVIAIILFIHVFLPYFLTIVSNKATCLQDFLENLKDMFPFYLGTTYIVVYVASLYLQQYTSVLPVSGGFTYKTFEKFIGGSLEYPKLKLCYRSHVFYHEVNMVLWTLFTNV